MISSIGLPPSQSTIFRAGVIDSTGAGELDGPSFRDGPRRYGQPSLGFRANLVTNGLERAVRKVATAIYAMASKIDIDSRTLVTRR